VTSSVTPILSSKSGAPHVAPLAGTVGTDVGGGMSHSDNRGTLIFIRFAHDRRFIDHARTKDCGFANHFLMGCKNSVTWKDVTLM
jgi:hypothetical protein